MYKCLYCFDQLICPCWINVSISFNKIKCYWQYCTYQWWCIFYGEVIQNLLQKWWSFLFAFLWMFSWFPFCQYICIKHALFSSLLQIEELASTLSYGSRSSSLDSLSSLDSVSGSPGSSPVPRGASPLHNRFRLSAKKALLLWVRDQCQKWASSLANDFKHFESLVKLFSLFDGHSNCFSKYCISPELVAQPVWGTLSPAGRVVKCSWPSSAPLDLSWWTSPKPRPAATWKTWRKHFTLLRRSLEFPDCLSQKVKTNS